MQSHGYKKTQGRNDGAAPDIGLQRKELKSLFIAYYILVVIALKNYNVYMEPFVVARGVLQYEGESCQVINGFNGFVGVLIHLLLICNFLLHHYIMV